ncbi:MAG: putative DNA binding domain-containing protein [Muribaculaceae bacterium]|nr:putative DNA binding domain-containing protein [Muribaculaceae bacterium]
MISKKEIQRLLNDLESDRVERTISTDKMDKFGEAICSFSNDLPDYQKPGYLIIGADDKTGKVMPVKITDALLKNLASIRTEGNVQPQPSMIVEKVELDEGPVVVVEVPPAHFPPVKYKGKICVRIGPRRGFANEDDERRLYEKRASHVQTFDAMPCLGSSLEDLDVRLFRQQYLPMAYPEEILENDKRDVILQLQSLGFYDMKHDCPTYAGILMFGRNLERRLPGAYVQYVRFDGDGRGAEIASDYKFSGNLMTILSQLDTFVSTTIAKKRPVPVSALREENLVDYPSWAIRELLMNAICHRDYESNGPIQFYQYVNRIEILNPGGLYGKANPRNFPLVNDYRNGVLAEAMKVIGFVNRFSRGVQRVQEELKANGNEAADFDLGLETAFLVKVMVAKKTIVSNHETKDETKDETKVGHGAYVIYSLIAKDPSVTRDNIVVTTGLSTSSVNRGIAELKRKKVIERIGGKRYGYWQILKEINNEKM